MKIYVTGIGIITAIGLNASENFAGLENGKTGICKSSKYNLMMGEVALSDEALIHLLNLPAKDYSRTTLLSLVAAKEAWGENKHAKGIRTGLISATSVGGMDKTENYYYAKKVNPSIFDKMTFENGGTTEEVASVLGISGFVDTISTACSSGVNSIIHGTRLMHANKLDRVLVGGCDPLALLDITGFHSLNIFDDELCKPFDADRNGLNLGEGAAFLVLENEHSVNFTKNEILCQIAGWGNATDAYHQTASSPYGFGATLAMQQALKKASLKPEDIDYINAHGTGTPNNDASESAALINVFGETPPPFSSTKGFTGHTLAAAGAIESVFCVQSLVNQIIPPNIHFQTPIEETQLIPNTAFEKTANLRHVLSNSFGFGGNCSSIIFSEVGYDY